MVESLRRRTSRFGLDIIFVNVWEGTGAAEEAAGYCQRWGIEATMLMEDTGQYARALGIRGVPTNVFVDESGIVRCVGASTSDELLREATCLEPRLAELTAEPLASQQTPADFAAPDGS